MYFVGGKLLFTGKYDVLGTIEKQREIGVRYERPKQLYQTLRSSISIAFWIDRDVIEIPIKYNKSTTRQTRADHEPIAEPIIEQIEYESCRRTEYALFACACGCVVSDELVLRENSPGRQ